DAARRVYQQGQVGRVHDAQAGTGWAHAFGLVEGKVSHTQFGDGCAAVRTGISVLGGPAGIASRLVIPDLKPGDVVGWGDILAADGAGLLADAGEEHAQVSENFC